MNTQYLIEWTKTEITEHERKRNNALINDDNNLFQMHSGYLLAMNNLLNKLLYVDKEFIINIGG